MVCSAFDLIELAGKDLRWLPIESRKRMLSKLVRGPHPGVVCNEHYEGDGEIVFQHACKLGCEGIVSKRLGSMYCRGRSPHWVKVKNPEAPAVRREFEEDWGSPHLNRLLSNWPAQSSDPKPPLWFSISFNCLLASR
jgi:ATP dependent DNA ligase domain